MTIPSAQTMLEPCPFCGKELARKIGRINPMARCTTEGCIVAAKMAVINLDDPIDVERWNTRTNAPAVALPVREPSEYIDMADNRLECAELPAGCPKCVEVARSYLKEANAILAALPSEAAAVAAREPTRDETLRGLADFFSESVHHVWDSGEIASCLTDMINKPALPSEAIGREEAFKTCIMMVEEECRLDAAPGEPGYEQAMHKVGLILRDRMQCALRNPDTSMVSRPHHSTPEKQP